MKKIFAMLIFTICFTACNDHDVFSSANGIVHGVTTLATASSGCFYGGIVADSHHNIFVSDYCSSKIVEFHYPSYIASDFATGFGTHPFGSMAIDSSDNIIVADTGNCVIKQISPSGSVSIIAGTGACSAETDNGDEMQADFLAPTAVALDQNSGVIFVVDSGGAGHLRELFSGAVVTETSNDFSGVSALTVDTNGNVYGTDPDANVIRKVEPNNSWAVSVIAGSGSSSEADGSGTGASFKHPNGIAIAPSGLFYIADIQGYTIRQMDALANVTTFAGNGTNAELDGSYLSAEFSFPAGIFIESSGRILVVDYGASTIRAIQ